MGENENDPKRRPCWERAVRVLAFVAGIADLAMTAGALLGWDVPGIRTEVHVYEVREGSGLGYAVIAVFVATTAITWLTTRRKR